MPTLYPYRLFVSHAWRYSDDYNGVISLLDRAPNFEYRNYSVPRFDPVDADNDSRLRRKITDQMNPTQIVLIVAGMYAAHSYWIEYEIREAQRLRKPILGIRKWDSERIPDAVKAAANEMVYWQSSSIVSAIRRLVP